MKAQFLTIRKKKVIKFLLTLEDLNLSTLRKDSKGNYVIQYVHMVNDNKKIRYSITAVINCLAVDQLFSRSLSKNARFTGTLDQFSAHFSMEFPLLPEITI